MTGNVRVDWQAFADWVDEDEPFGLVIEDEPKRDSAQSLALVLQAVEYADATYGTPEARAMYGHWVREIGPSPWGPAVYMDGYGAEDLHRSWLEAFAEHLSQAGWSGVVVPHVHQGRWSHPGPVNDLPAFGTFLGVTQDARATTPGRTGRLVWGVSPARTHAVVDALTGWATAAGGHIIVSQDRFSAAAPDVATARERIVEALDQDFPTRISCVEERSVTDRRVSFWYKGEIECGNRLAAADDWRTGLDHARTMLERVGAVLDIGFVRIARSAMSWQDVERTPQGLPFDTGPRLSQCRDLWDHYLPDAHGVQVVTRAHLDKIGTLTGWNVREIAPDKYWVEADDLEPWYSTPTPDPHTLATARATFADAILTPEIIAAHLGLPR